MSIIFETLLYFSFAGIFCVGMTIIEFAINSDSFKEKAEKSEPVAQTAAA